MGGAKSSPKNERHALQLLFSVNLAAIMKNLFKAETTSTSRKSEVDETLKGLPNANLVDRWACRPSVPGYGWPVQSSRSSVNRRDESDLMKSQLS
jgi:hypothetical protein